MHGATRSLSLRVLISTTVGVAMVGMTLVGAFRMMRNSLPYTDTHRYVCSEIGFVIDCLEDFRKEKGRYPERLVDIKGALSVRLAPDSAGRILDSWQHPFDYWSDGQSYTLRSLGLDGRPGGQGLDRDLDSRDIVVKDKSCVFRRHEYFPTFWQFTFELDTRPVKITCALAGVFAAVACFVTLGNQRVRPAGMLGRLFVTVVMCWYAALIIASLHVPNGH